MPIMRLRLPAEDAARVGWIVGQVPAAGEFTVHPHRDRAAKWCDTGHWIAVGIAARIVEAAAAHVIAIVRHRRVAILAIQTLRRCLDEKCCACDVTRIEPGGPRNAVLEEPAAGSVQFVIAEDGPLFERPMGIVDGGRRRAGIRTRRPSASVAAAGASPSTMNVVKLRCRTESFASESRVASTNVAGGGSFGIVMVSGARGCDIHGRYGTRLVNVSHVRRSPSAFHPYSSARKVSESPNVVIPVRNEA